MTVDFSKILDELEGIENDYSAYFHNSNSDSTAAVTPPPQKEEDVEPLKVAWKMTKTRTKPFQLDAPVPTCRLNFKENVSKDARERINI